MAACEHRVYKGQRGDERPEINSTKNEFIKKKKLDFLFVFVHYQPEK